MASVQQLVGNNQHELSVYHGAQRHQNQSHLASFAFFRHMVYSGSNLVYVSAAIFKKKTLKKKEQMETTTFKQFMVARRVPHSGIGQYAHIVYHTVHEFGTVFYMGYPG